MVKRCEHCGKEFETENSLGETKLIELSFSLFIILILRGRCPERAILKF